MGRGQGSAVQGFAHMARVPVDFTSHPSWYSPAKKKLRIDIRVSLRDHGTSYHGGFQSHSFGQTIPESKVASSRAVKVAVFDYPAPGPLFKRPFKGTATYHLLHSFCAFNPDPQSYYICKGLVAVQGRWHLNVIIYLEIEPLEIQSITQASTSHNFEYLPRLSATSYTSTARLRYSLNLNRFFF